MEDIIVKNQPLMDALNAFAKSPSIDTERNIYLALEEAVFLLPATIEQNFSVVEGRVVRVEEGAEIRIAQFTDEEGNRLYPTFTSVEHASHWPVDLEEQNIYLAQMTMSGLNELLSNQNEVAGFIINPYDENVIFGMRQLERYHEVVYEEANKSSLEAPLTRLLDQLRQMPTVELENKIYRMFQNIRFLMPIQVPNPSTIAEMTDDGVVALVDNTPINVMPLENEVGEQLFPVFTDLYQARRSGIGANPSEHRYLIEINFEGVESLVNNNPNVTAFAINPFDHNIVLGAPQFVHYHELKGDAMPIDRQTTIQESENDALVQQLPSTPEQEAAVISALADDPYHFEYNVSHAKLEKALTKEMRSNPSIVRAYLAKKVYSDSDAYLVVLEKERDGKSVMDELRQRANTVLKDEKIEFASHNEDEVQEVLSNVAPFYDQNAKRGWFGRRR